MSEAIFIEELLCALMEQNESSEKLHNRVINLKTLVNDYISNGYPPDLISLLKQTRDANLKVRELVENYYVESCQYRVHG